MSLSTYAKNLTLEGLPDTIYVAFFAGGAPGVGTEVAPLTLWGVSTRPAFVLAAASSAARVPSTTTTLGTAVSSQAVTHIAYYDAASAGNLLADEAFATTIASGSLVEIPTTTQVFAIS